MGMVENQMKVGKTSFDGPHPRKTFSFKENLNQYEDEK